MKKLIKILLSVIVVIYAVVAMFLTACLLNYNDYKITVFGDKSLIIVNDDTLKDKYKKGSLLVVDKNGEEINKGDEIIFYNTYNNQVNISVAEVTAKEKITDTETTYTIKGDYDISSEYLIGSTKNVKTYGVIGAILGLLESRVGFLVFIIFPITLAFLYEIYVLIKEIKNAKEEVKKEEKKKKQKKEIEKEEE
ncbi:MAG: hypothetical protein E7170_00045 [Firmicutes bacterium]|nr:hypothetical protein [Bacillota bacterium]